jgi:hypothetical protein
MKIMAFYILGTIVMAILLAFFKSVIWASREPGRSWLDYRANLHGSEPDNKDKIMLTSEEFFLKKMEQAMALNRDILTERDKKILTDKDIFGFSEIMPDNSERDTWMDRMIGALLKLYDLESSTHIRKAKQLHENGKLKGFNLFLVPEQWISMHHQLIQYSGMIVLECVVGGWLTAISERQMDIHSGEDNISNGEVESQ